MNMWKRTLLCAALAAGCAGSNANTKSDQPAQGEGGQTAEAAPPAPKLHGPKKRIGIVDFDDSSHHGGWGGSRDALAEAARDVTTEAMVKSGAFVVVEREQIAQILKEQGLGMTGAISPQTAAKAGKIYITAGSDINLPVGATLSVRRLGEEITDPSTGAVIGHELGKTLGHLQLAEHLNEKLSVCVATQGATFATGDMVTLDASKA